MNAYVAKIADAQEAILDAEKVEESVIVAN